MKFNLASHTFTQEEAAQTKIFNSSAGVRLRVQKGNMVMWYVGQFFHFGSSGFIVDPARQEIESAYQAALALEKAGAPIE